jgi:hypothetical protein
LVDLKVGGLGHSMGVPGVPGAPAIKVYSNIFAFGDCCLTHVNEEKTVTPIKICAKILANNISTLANDGKALLAIPDKFPCIYDITLGPERGISIFNK